MRKHARQTRFGKMPDRVFFIFWPGPLAGDIMSAAAGGFKRAEALISSLG